MKDKKPINESGQQHGFWEIHYNDLQTAPLHWSSTFINGKETGIRTFYYTDGSIMTIANVVNGERVGLWKFYLCMPRKLLYKDYFII